jgi:hypothetical protein
MRVHVVVNQQDTILGTAQVGIARLEDSTQRARTNHP